MHPALEGLDDVPWSTLTHAYGEAVDVPGLLRELAGTRAQQEHALYELHGNIWHQGTVYEATAYVVPFVARLALAEPPPLRDELLDLLADIANGNSYLDVHQVYEEDGLSEEDKAAMRVELEHVAAGRAAVLAAVPELVASVLAQPTPGAFVIVARLAAAFPDDKDPLTPALQWIWENVDDAPVRGALAIALACRGEPHEYADAILNDLFSAVHRVS